MFRSPFLIWLCCALTLVVGLPVRGQAPCRAGKDAPTSLSATSSEGRSCCLTDCHCGHEVDRTAACGCEDERSPTPAPAAAGPRPEQAQEPEPLWLPKLTSRQCACDHAPRLRTDVGVAVGLLPHVSRQKALSVWSC